MHYDLGERKKRPGVYERHTNDGGSAVAGARNGYAAIICKADWGAENAVTEITDVNYIEKFYGLSNSDNTVGLIEELFNGGASTVYVSRLGKGGSKGSATLKDSSGTSCVDLTTKYPGKRALNVAVKTNLSDDTIKEFYVYEGSAQLEKIKFDVSNGSEIDNLIEAGAASAYFDFKKTASYSGDGKLQTGETIAITVGTNPSNITNEDYSAAMAALEPYRPNAVCIDVDTQEVQLLLVRWADRMFDEGRKFHAVIGIPKSVEFDTRLSRAKSLNDKCAVCVVNGFKVGETTYEGAKAAARVCGMVAQVPSESTLTRAVIQGATDLTEVLNDSQYNKCIASGALAFSKSQDGLIWIDKAITTFTVANDIDDLGWSKIKRGKIRFELMTRVDQTVDNLVAKVRNNDDGRATVTKAIKGVCEAMMKEEKIEPDYEVYLDPDNPPQGDEAWWVVSANDIDALEIVYLHYKFRFSPNV
jgi:hypothetical protein